MARPDQVAVEVAVRMKVPSVRHVQRVREVSVVVAARRVSWFPTTMNPLSVQGAGAARGEPPGPAFRAGHRGPLAP